MLDYVIGSFDFVTKTQLGALETRLNQFQIALRQ